MTNRKRVDFKCGNDYDSDNEVNDGMNSMTKKKKTPKMMMTMDDQLATIKHPKISSNSGAHNELCSSKQSTVTRVNGAGAISQGDPLKMASISKLPAQTPSAYHSRKRRSRMSQESLGSNSSASDSPSAASTSGANCGQLRKKTDLSCVVCRGLAHGYNFDAISCESCKAFFRRNALFNSERLKCRRDNDCEISLETRRRCKSCRLRKCFAVGMRKEWILTEEEKQNKKRRIEENRRLRLGSSTTDSSVLISEASSRTTTNFEAKFPLDLPIIIKNTSERILTGSNNDLIANVQSAYNDGFKSDAAVYGWSYPLARKLTALCQILNTKSTTALRLIRFYKRLNEFEALNENDKINLVKNNLPCIFFLYSSLGYDPIHDHYHDENTAVDRHFSGADIRQYHGEDIHTRCTFIMRALHSIVQLDKRIIQLALVIMLFARNFSVISRTSESLLDNHRQVFHAQNVYVQEMWIMMERILGPVNAVIVFSKLISECLLIQGLHCDVQHEKVQPCQVTPILRSLWQLA